MKIEMTCRCGAKASWEDANSSLARKCARQWAEEHQKCPPSAPGSELQELVLKLASLSPAHLAKS